MDHFAAFAIIVMVLVSRVSRATFVQAGWTLGSDPLGIQLQARAVLPGACAVTNAPYIVRALGELVRRTRRTLFVLRLKQPNLDQPFPQIVIGENRLGIAVRLLRTHALRQGRDGEVRP